MMLVASATTDARSLSWPGMTSVVLSLAILPNCRKYSSPIRSCIASVAPDVQHATESQTDRVEQPGLRDEIRESNQHEAHTHRPPQGVFTPVGECLDSDQAENQTGNEDSG